MLPNGPHFVPRSGVVLFTVLVLAVCCLSGCGKKYIPGYGGEPSGPVLSEQEAPGIDPANLPEGWGYVDVLCFKGVGRERGERDTLFGCLMHARNKGTGTLRLPKGVYLGHVADFIARALKFYHVEEHFEHLYGYRVVLALRPATPEEIAKHDNRDAIRFAAGTAGEIALTVLGAPFVPIIAPVVFAFEAVDADQEFQAYRHEAKAKGLPEPTRRGDEIVSEEYAARYGRYWDHVAGDENVPKDRVPLMYMVERCYLAHPEGGRTNLVKAED
ncbi:hypothetical protein [Desulfovibrio ferrophilus]|uniref:Uncharacterized protein n=1 Tax=Desulfovibrio ferrophilus TaxID=241368 RepID=A0A2Z6AYS4_9BACT|nr:hypothetical protein [Desulfovibrio ferrophilus]BBD08378.1 uncharacterized protein DFE_1652 [Desulfovibrio ferrophilus]